MDYYILKAAVATQETGTEFPQVQSMSPGYNYKAENSTHSLRVGKFPKTVPNLDYFVLHKKAKLTDLLSEAVTGGGGMLISQKLKNILEGYNLIPHQFYQAKVKDKDTLYENYYWMHLDADLTNYVDYPNSNFIIYRSYTYNDGNIEVSSKKDLLEKRKIIKEKYKNSTIWSHTIKLTPDFDYSLDLFEISTFDSNYYVSERLKNQLVEENITGIELTPAHHLIPF